MRIKALSLVALTCLFFIIPSCKTVSKNTVTSNGQNGQFVPKNGFSPVGFDMSLDPDKEAKLIAALGTADFKKVNAINLTPTLLKDWQLSASKAMEERKALEENKTYASWASNTWVVDAVFKDAFGTPELTAGTWIEFKNDFTYLYGKYEKVNGKGVYHYSPVDEVVILLDDDKDVKPLEFINSWDNGFTVIGGTDTYGDNGMIIKIINQVGRPKKQK